MNTKWEKEFDDGDWMNFGGDQWCGCSMKNEEIKAFIKDQITEAEKRGYEKGQIDQTYLMVNTLRDINKGNHSPKGSDMPCCSFCKCNGQPVEVVDGLMHVAHTWHDGDCHDLKCQCHQSASKASQLADPITKAQQEIAEQILQELDRLKKEKLDKNDPDNYEACYAIAGFNDALSQARDQLRKKYIKKNRID